jgi:hypothetical protein
MADLVQLTSFNHFDKDKLKEVLTERLDAIPSTEVGNSTYFHALGMLFIEYSKNHGVFEFDGGHQAFMSNGFTFELIHHGNQTKMIFTGPDFRYGDVRMVNLLKGLPVTSVVFEQKIEARALPMTL